jgi:hypothetical protein
MHQKEYLKDAMEGDLGYLAGTIDSDGYLTIIHCQGARRDRGGRIYHRCIPRIGVVSTFPEVLEFLKAMGFSIHKHANAKNGLVISNKPIWEATVLGLEPVKKCLEKLLPYLKGKRKRAELILKFIALRQSHPEAPGGYLPYSEVELELVKAVKSIR